MTDRALSPAEAQKYYDRFGSKQDNQGWYEDAAVHSLIQAANFDQAIALFEFGCGTGRVAEILLDDHLPPTATYQGVDISRTMVDLSQSRLARFGQRAIVQQYDPPGSPPLSGRSVDRFLSTYVLDLLPLSQIDQTLAWAYQILDPGGLLCLAGLTSGCGLLSGLVMRAWQAVHALNPLWVGGCRPLELVERLDAVAWTIEMRDVVVSRGIASEVIVARKA